MNIILHGSLFAHVEEKIKTY